MAEPSNDQPANPTPGGKGWYVEVIPPHRRAYVENKGWRGPAEMLESYINLEKRLGAGAPPKGEKR